MRLDRGVPMLAAVVTLAGVSAPAAYGFDNRTAGRGGQPTAALVQRHPSSSPDWVLIGVAAGAITLAGAGQRASRSPRPAATPRGARPAGGS